LCLICFTKVIHIPVYGAIWEEIMKVGNWQSAVGRLPAAYCRLLPEFIWDNTDAANILTQ
jgi:hypothetical protein